MKYIRGNTLAGVRSLGTPSNENRVSQVKVRDYRGIVDSVGAMRQLAADGQSHPNVRRYAERVIRKVYPKDYLSELAAIYYDVCRTSRYTRDPAGHEYVQHPAVALESRATDCDDQATLLRSVIGSLASAGMSVGNDMQFVVAGFVKDAPPNARYTHVFLRVMFPKLGKYLVLDPVAGPNTPDMLSRIRTAKVFPT